MNWLAAAALVMAVPAGLVQGPDSPVLVPACQGVSVSLAAEAARVKAGDRPQFTVAVANNTQQPVRILDITNGRRGDLQATYLELFVVRDRSLVDVRMPIADPGPVFPADFLELGPGARVEFRRLIYKRALEELRPGGYEAFVLFWRDPLEPHTTRCRSTSAQFVVFE